MKFWDSSAVIPLCLKEQMSERLKSVMKADEEIIVWWASRWSACLPCRDEGERVC